MIGVHVLILFFASVSRWRVGVLALTKSLFLVISTSLSKNTLKVAIASFEIFLES